jgi:hypothetical protein
MDATDQEIDSLACRMVAVYGLCAAIAAAERLNECIDRDDSTGRETWARVVHRIHEYQHSNRPNTSAIDTASRL